MLQLVGLTAIVLLVIVIEYKFVEAEFQGRHGALLSMRQKMSKIRSTLQRSDARMSDLVRRTSSVFGETTEDAGARVRTAGVVGRMGARDSGEELDIPPSKIGCTPENDGTEELVSWKCSV